MPPRARFTAERILDAAYLLTQTDGIGMVTARNIASTLGCSTGPIFTHFASMDALFEQLMDRIISAFVTRASAFRDDDPLIAAGVGWLQFAVEEPKLYEAVFLRPHPWHAKWGPVRRLLADEMRSHSRYAHLDESTRFALVGRASIVMHGLGVELWSGRLPNQNNLRKLIQELAGPVVETAISKGWHTDLHARQPQQNPSNPQEN